MFVEDTTYCHGANTVIFTRRYCEVPVSLFSDPSYLFKLTAGDLIQAKVVAHNANGWGEFSDETLDDGTSASTLKTTPDKMNMPTRDATTTELRLVVDWVA